VSYSELVLKDYADILWPLDDISSSSSLSYPINFTSPSPGSYSASISTDHTNLESVPIIFGGNTALQFTSSAVGMSIPAQGRFSNEYKDKTSTLSFWIKINDIDYEEQPIVKRRGLDNVGLFIKENYFIFKYGNSASYSMVVSDISSLDEPHHIMISSSKDTVTMSVDGLTYKPLISFSSQPDYDSNQDNDVLDFYGPIQGSWEIDCPVFYPYTLPESVCKRHYVYGVGKWVSNDIFYSRGGIKYNFSTLSTKKLSEISWDYPREWRFTDYKDLRANDQGIQGLRFSLPNLQSFDNIIEKNNNSVKFSTSGSVTKTSYIDVESISEKIIDGSYPTFIKFTLNGELPGDENYQTMAVYGEIPEDPYLIIDLYNNAGQYQVRFSDQDYSNSSTFDIQNITASPEIYVGFRFSGASEFYFSQTGSAVQTASFSFYDSEGFGQDPLVSHFPPAPSTRLRIGGTLSYDLKNTTPTAPLDFYQFRGTFNKIMVVQDNEISSLASFNDIESYRKSRYVAQYLTNQDRFKVSTYGNATWNIHSIDMSEFIDDDNLVVGSNVIELGYPFFDSASQVSFTATHLTYTGSVVYPETSLQQKNNLSFINNKNLLGTYLKFNLDIYTDDLYYYPPKIKYFRMETYPTASVGEVIIKDDSGPNYTLYPTSSSQVYIPETRLTPTIFLKNDSGIKLQETFSDFSDLINPEPLDPRTIDGLKLWLDSRFPTGLRRSPYLDDTRVDTWFDLSGNNNDAVSQTASTSPIYRLQSLNLLKVNQLSGSEENDLSNILSNGVNIESSNYGVISGTQAILVTPDFSTVDSYIDVSTNTASITVFPNQTYTVVGSIRLDKRQTASALSEFARSIVIYEINSSSTVFSVQSASADNSSGIYSLSAIFTTSSSATGAILRFYNGSYNPDDIVYWDNLGLYPVGDISGSISSWQRPLTGNDSPTIKFDGINTSLSTPASASQPYTMYVVGRAFNDGVFVGYSASGASIFSYEGSYYVDSGTSASQVSATNEFNIYAIQFNSGSARLFLNGLSYYRVESGHDSIIDGMLLGKGTVLGVNSLSGDISAVLLYEGTHNYLIRSNIETWLDESFNLIHSVLPLTPADNVYLDEYTERYPLLPWL